MIACKEDKEIIRTKIEEANSNGIFVDKRLFIFGCTIYARDIKDALVLCGLYPFAMIDNNPRKVGTKCMGLDVYSPDLLVTFNAIEYVIVIASKYHTEMIGQLMRLGVRKSQIIDLPVSESIMVFDDGKEMLENSINQRRAGIAFYNNIQSKYKDINKMFLCPYPGTGDIYMACGFLKEYLRVNNIQKYLLCVVGENCKKVALLFEIPYIEVINEDESSGILRAWEFYGEKIIHIKPLLHWGWRTKKYLFSNNHPHITFAEMFKYDVFELNEDATFSHPCFEEDPLYAEELFRKLGLKKNRTIILAPYASSFVSEIATRQWEELVRVCVKQGYTVCTNSFGENESVIKGTVQIQFPYEKAKSVLELAGTFIGIRSGLCDVISSIRCKQIILYENGFNASDIVYFGLKNMGINTNAKEYVYEEGSLVDLIGDEL